MRQSEAREPTVVRENLTHRRFRAHGPALNMKDDTAAVGTAAKVACKTLVKETRSLDPGLRRSRESVGGPRSRATR
ncbi:hypothetical protein POSPLADRAFT_1065708 [Postia placenta MAD-698-R-SB12]|uniref:Uncharacterized protein n=1 Tax=Postia placenta MAD-698-R-SB12 TaxID=670580 RepID=A0A1X6N4B6_9APHY|nr:hypothetical protein POSPLADRAFT_1065708 [Postia placenta MAD-698-R-SB12]OSX63457.1 hypothetical protein POSPLADRAFT_1065708 [Postia placenta MAD-698-R-SB12]